MQMNQTLFFLTFLLFVCSSVPFRAQDAPREQRLSVTGGPLLETPFSGFYHSGVDGGQSRMRAGCTVGGFLDLGITPAFSVQGELLVHYKHSLFEWGGRPGDYRYWGMEIPLYVCWHRPQRRGGLWNLGAGPYTEFGLDATFRHGGRKADLYEKDQASGLPILRDSNTGLALRVGYEFACGLQVNFAYKVSLTNLLDANSNTVEMHPHTLSMGLGYRFGK